MIDANVLTQAARFSNKSSRNCDETPTTTTWNEVLTHQSEQI